MTLKLDLRSHASRDIPREQDGPHRTSTDEQRAGEIILGLRNLLNNRTEADLRPSDVNDTIRDVVRIVSPEVAGRGVLLRTLLASEALLVRSDPIHLQQAIINLVMNGMEAMEEARLTI
jgi:C4-dicarboxylate-specific signal transduction histidine kinase